MADYFTNFSFVMPLPNEAAEKYALDLAQQAERIQQGDEADNAFPEGLREFIDDWTFETNAGCPAHDWGIWLHPDAGGIQSVCAFIQHLLTRFDPNGYVSFEWSHDCTKPRLGAFGGGAVIITSRKVNLMSTGTWRERQLARMSSSKERPPR
jgi:hypothetical protein